MGAVHLLDVKKGNGMLNKTLPGLALGAVTLGGALVAPAQAMAAPANCVGDLSGNGWLNVEVSGVRSSGGLVAIKIGRAHV